LAGVAIERKLTYDRLQRSESYLAEAQNLSHTGSFGWDPETDELYWSAETFRIHELDPANPLEFARVFQRTHPDDRACLEQTLDRARRDRKDYELEYRLLMADGSVKHLQMVARAMVDESGRFEYVGTMMDVTQRKLAEEAQRLRSASAKRRSCSGNRRPKWRRLAGLPAASRTTSTTCSARS
jgi:PAS domain-containing protein